MTFGSNSLRRTFLKAALMSNLHCQERFLEFVIISVKKVEGHYQIALPLRNIDISMPNNKRLVEQRLCCLKRRFQKDLMFHTEYNMFINDLLKVMLRRCPKRSWAVAMEKYGTYQTTEFTIPPNEKSELCLTVEQDIKEHH